MFVYNIKMFFTWRKEQKRTSRKDESIRMFKNEVCKKESHHIIRKANAIMMNAHAIMITIHHRMPNAHAMIINEHHVLVNAHHIL